MKRTFHSMKLFYCSFC